MKNFAKVFKLFNFYDFFQKSVKRTFHIKREVVAKEQFLQKYPFEWAKYKID